MSARDRVPEPPRNPAGRPPDPGVEIPNTGRPRHMKARPGPVPDQWATYRLVSVAARLNERRLNRRLAGLGLTTGSLDALDTAAELEPTTVTDLAAILCVSRQSLGKVVRRLQNLGLLTRERGIDGRSADICLTGKGRDVLSAAESLVQEGSETEAEAEALFRHQLEQHILHLRNTEPSRGVRHGPRQRRSATSSSSNNMQDPSHALHTEKGVDTWLLRTALPDQKQPSKKQPRQ